MTLVLSEHLKSWKSYLGDLVQFFFSFHFVLFCLHLASALIKLFIFTSRIRHGLMVAHGQAVKACLACCLPVRARRWGLRLCGERSAGLLGDGHWALCIVVGTATARPWLDNSSPLATRQSAHAWSWSGLELLTNATSHSAFANRRGDTKSRTTKEKSKSKSEEKGQTDKGPGCWGEFIYSCWGVVVVGSKGDWGTGDHGRMRSSGAARATINDGDLVILADRKTRTGRPTSVKQAR